MTSYSYEKYEDLRYDLFIASRENRLIKVKNTLKKLMSDSQFKIGDTTWGFLEACRNGYIDIVKLYISIGADPLTQNSICIKDASYYYHHDIVEYLCNHVIEKRPADIVKIKDYLPDSLVIKYDYLLAAGDMDLL